MNTPTITQTHRTFSMVCLYLDSSVAPLVLCDHGWRRAGSARNIPGCDDKMR
jgi:hypothetical protein